MQRHEALQHLLIIAQRMVGNVKADDFLFVLQNKLLGDFRQRRQLDFRHAEAIVTEQSQLAVGLVPLAGSTQINRLVHNSQHLRSSGAEGIHCAAFNHIFDNTLVDHAHIHTAAEIRQTLERTALVTGADNGIYCGITGIFDACQAEADGCILMYRKVVAAFVDIRRQDFDIIITADVDIPAHLIRITDNAVEEGRIELRTPVRLQISCFIGYQRIGYGVGFVEAVTGEVLQERENLVAELFGNIMQLLGTVDERLAHRIQLLGLLLAHRAAQNICLTERKACQCGGYLHNLLLIQNNAVGILQNRLHQRMQHLRRALSVTAGNKVLRHTGAQRTRTVQSHQRNQILKAFGSQIHNQLGDTCRLQLENAGRFTAAQHSACCLICQRNVININLFTRSFADKANAVTDNCQRAQA